MVKKSEIFEVIDERIGALKRKIEWFDKFGNPDDQQELIRHAINLSCKDELLYLKNDLLYSVDWGRDDSKQEG